MSLLLEIFHAILIVTSWHSFFLFPGTYSSGSALGIIGLNSHKKLVILYQSLELNHPDVIIMIINSNNVFYGVFIDSGHYVSYIRQSNKWYHCDDKHITETNLLTLSNNVYLMFYAKEVDLGT